MEGTFFDADTTSDAKNLRDVDNFRSGGDFDTDFLGLVDGTSLLALLFAPFGLALLRVDNSDSMFVLHK